MEKLRTMHATFIFIIVLGVVGIGLVYALIRFNYVSFSEDGIWIKPVLTTGEVKELLITENTDQYELEARYPADAPQEVQKFVTDVLTTFRGYEYIPVGDAKYMLNLDYELYKTDDYTSYVIEFYEYTGGANGNGVQETFVYNQDGSLATFEQVFAPETRAQVVANLLVQLEQEYPDSLFEDALTEQSPALENFFVSPEGKGFAFSEYDILPGVYGPVTVMYGTKTVDPSKILITDFDTCAQAGNPIAESYPRQCFHDGETFVEEVEPIKDPSVSGGCVVGGCSGQLCISASEAANGGGISTCEFREEYACYQNAVCEEQSNGACGWTMTPALTQCLQSPPALQ